MPREYLHNHRQFADLFRIVGAEKGIDPIVSMRMSISDGGQQEYPQQSRVLLGRYQTRALYEKACEAGSALYYQGKPTFGEILATLKVWKDAL